MVHRKAHWSRVLEMLPLKCLPLKWCSTQCWAPLEIWFPVPGIDEIKIYQFVISDFSSFWEAFNKSQTKFCDGHKFVICENKNIGNAPCVFFFCSRSTNCKSQIYIFTDSLSDDEIYEGGCASLSENVVIFYSQVKFIMSPTLPPSTHFPWFVSHFCLLNLFSKMTKLLDSKRVFKSDYKICMACIPINR